MSVQTTTHCWTLARAVESVGDAARSLPDWRFAIYGSTVVRGQSSNDLDVLAYRFDGPVAPGDIGRVLTAWRGTEIITERSDKLRFRTVDGLVIDMVILTRVREDAV